MANDRLIGKASTRLALKILAMVGHLIRPNEHNDAYAEFEAAAREEVERYETAAGQIRRPRQIDPSEN